MKITLLAFRAAKYTADGFSPFETSHDYAGYFMESFVVNFLAHSNMAHGSRQINA